MTAALLLLFCAPGVASAQTIEEQQWHLSAMDVYTAHGITRGEGVVVAVVDSGVDPSRPDLEGRLLPGYGVGTAKSDVDEDGHGTAMATLIAGTGADGGALGVAPGAKVLPVGLGTSDGHFAMSSVVKGVRWAVDNGAEVINLSLTTEATLTPDLLRAVDYAFDRDVVVVAGTGNDGKEHVGAPANIKGVIAVGGTAPDGSVWPQSNFGPETVLTAPAAGIVTAVPLAVSSTGYAAVDGTSAATALVSGVAALIRAEYPSMSAGNVANRLIATAKDLLSPGRDPQTGFGAVDPVAALTAEIPEVPQNPLLPSTAPPTTTTTQSQIPPRQEAAQAPPHPGPPSSTARALTALATLAAAAVITLVVAVVLARRTRPKRPQLLYIPPPTDDFWRQ